MPDISVIIPAFNAGPFIREAIESVLAQSMRAREIIVIDDGSTDQTAAVIESFGPRVTPVRQANQGVAAARNHGARMACSEWLAFLDADDAWRPRKLEAQMGLAAAEGTHFVHCASEKVNQHGRFLSHQLDGLSGQITEGMLMFRGNHANGSTTLLARSLFETVGGYDSGLSTSADWDLCFRLGRLARVGFVGEPLALYRQHGANMHANPALMRKDMLRAFEKAFKNSGPELLLLRRRAYGALHLMLAGSFAAYGDRSRAVRHGLAAVIWNPAAILPVLRGSWRDARRLVGRSR